MLYPQTAPSSFLPFNPQACWDWWSYVNHEDSYVTKSGPQIRTIKAMLDALTARAVPTAAPAPEPAGLTIIDSVEGAAALLIRKTDRGEEVFASKRFDEVPQRKNQP